MKWKRTATGVVAVAVFAVTALAVSASEPTSATANSALGPKLPPLPSGSLTATPKPFLSTGTGPTTGVLVTINGQALYYNDQDALALNACTATCALVWHPLRPPANTAISVGPDVTGAVSTLMRADGTMQVTYNGRGLYTYTVDAIGHLNGDGLIDSYDGHAFQWHAATASGQPLPSAPPTAPGSPGLPTPGGSGLPGIPVPSGGSSPILPTPTPTPTPAPNPTVPA